MTPTKNQNETAGSGHLTNKKGTRMKAVLCTKYGAPDVLQLREVLIPTPGDKEVLIKIYASTVTMGDCELRSLTLPFWTRIPLRLFMGCRTPRQYIPVMEFS